MKYENIVNGIICIMFFLTAGLFVFYIVSGSYNTVTIGTNYCEELGDSWELNKASTYGEFNCRKEVISESGIGVDYEYTGTLFVEDLK